MIYYHKLKQPHDLWYSRGKRNQSSTNTPSVLHLSRSLHLSYTTAMKTWPQRGTRGLDHTRTVPFAGSQANHSNARGKTSHLARVQVKGDLHWKKKREKPWPKICCTHLYASTAKETTSPLPSSFCIEEATPTLPRTKCVILFFRFRQSSSFRKSQFKRTGWRFGFYLRQYLRSY